MDGMDQLINNVCNREDSDSNNKLPPHLLPPLLKETGQFRKLEKIIREQQ